MAMSDHTDGRYLPARNAAALGSLLGRGPQPTRPRVDDDGEPLAEILSKALAHATGAEYQPPKVRELEQVLGPENFKLLMENPKIEAGIQVWLHATEGEKAKVIRSLAILIADEVGMPELKWRIRKEIGAIK
jgi:hypothetical protein